jgi:hypothetical protein
MRSHDPLETLLQYTSIFGMRKYVELIFLDGVQRILGNLIWWPPQPNESRRTFLLGCSKSSARQSHRVGDNYEQGAPI